MHRTGIFEQRKRCSACAEKVKTAALVYRYCGHDFRVSAFAARRWEGYATIGDLTGASKGQAPKRRPRLPLLPMAFAALVAEWNGHLVRVGQHQPVARRAELRARRPTMRSMTKGRYITSSLKRSRR